MKNRKRRRRNPVNMVVNINFVIHNPRPEYSDFGHYYAVITIAVSAIIALVSIGKEQVDPFKIICLGVIIISLISIIVILGDYNRKQKTINAEKEKN